MNLHRLLTGIISAWCAATALAQPQADYGDAPDDLKAGYAPPFQDVIGRFPTRYATANSRYGLPKRLETETGVQSLVISGDLNDLRCISDEQTKTNIEAFIEQIEEGK